MDSYAFRKQKLKEINAYYTSSTYYSLYNMIAGMFEYGDEFPDYLYSEDIEILNLHKGFSAVLDNREKDGQFKIGMISGFNYDDYLRPIGKCDFYTRFNEYGTHEIGKDVIVCYNNKLRLPELKINSTTNNLTEIEKSKRVAMVNTRFTNIPVIFDDNMKVAIDNVIKDISEGKPVSCVTSAFIECLKENGKTKMLELTRPEDAEKIQYIYKAYDDEMRDFLEFYGQTYSATAKMAQVNSDELQGGFNFSRVNPMNMLSCRQRFIDKVNETFNVKWSVDFSPAWQHLKQKAIGDTSETSEIFDVEKSQNENDEKGVDENDT